MEETSGLIVTYGTDKYGIAYHEDQEKSFKNKDTAIEKNRTVLVTPVSKTFTPLDEPKRIVKASKLNIIGFCD